MDPPASHQPVLLEETVRLLSPAGRQLIVDCTIGLGGHAEALLHAAGPEAMLIGLDLDEANLRRAKTRLLPFAGRVRLFQANYRQLPVVLEQVGAEFADAILADLGVASSQIDDPSRGFSFMADGPLNMRMDASGGTTAAQLVNKLGQKELADLIYEFGEERYSRRIARKIVETRRAGPIETTSQLSAIVAAAYPAAVKRSRRGVHPATRTFQALRIAVNDELAGLDALLAMLPDVLTVGGRAAVISFHSLEDRRVKHAFAGLAEAGAAKVLTGKPVIAAAEEMARNPRSRSAKLRCLEMIGRADQA